ncbi:hypothetical protein GGTG_06788 [Gaeumannomyces tritici R3-111a-1]|uniref:Uncharacterized protein n=1 Tax=Gaeumannomyces tritici (strain R3-111a-1) TaxID=644352 RepID=J3NZU1_GAET3|nr:hypothetical protein GGTG_06788 [Gaeumannomyces tritici R3-111a-1]EJT76874.1 hypothetical protein GGTG_06788 [Gaeumannomyces tritici R3-111a-1]
MVHTCSAYLVCCETLQIERDDSPAQSPVASWYGLGIEQANGQSTGDTTAEPTLTQTTVLDERAFSSLDFTANILCQFPDARPNQKQRLLGVHLGTDYDLLAGTTGQLHGACCHGRSRSTETID